MIKQLKDELLGRISRHLMLQGSFGREIGLLDGKMGIAIFFFYYSRYKENSIYEDFGGELINEIYEEIHVNTPVNFKEGLCGIGWGFEYLIQNRFVSVAIDDIFEDFDKRVLEVNVKNMEDTSLETGLEGIARYVISRFGRKEILRERNHIIGKEFVTDLIRGLSRSDDNKKQDIIDLLQNIVDDKPVCRLSENDLKEYIDTLAFDDDEPFRIQNPLGIENYGVTGLGLRLMMESMETKK